ncbi:MAG: trypsin-like peptidase domain-containing protein [Candidatus Sungbacteria bacterium]|nr:trypsin-like peptidase domain-containing protein [Candidatus Sungbacteria bacterium]
MWKSSCAHFVLIAILAIGFVGYDAVGAGAEYKPLDIQNLPDFTGPFEGVVDKIVWIKTYRRERIDSEDGDYIVPKITGGLGSGVIISSEKLADERFESKIITNQHVIDGAEKINVFLYFSQWKAFKAELIGFDDLRDLALLRIITPRKLSPAAFGDTDRLKIGEVVYMVGNPAKSAWSLSVGFVGNLGRDVLLETIQFNGATNSGNSGGGLFNTKRELIGVITTAAVNGTIGFATSVNVIRKILPALEKGGRVLNGYLGARVEEMERDGLSEDMAKEWGVPYPLPKESAVVVMGVTKGTSAERAGVAVGDIILEFNGREILHPRYLEKLVAESEIGKEVPIRVLRGSTEIVLQITPMERPVLTIE